MTSDRAPKFQKAGQVAAHAPDGNPSERPPIPSDRRQCQYLCHSLFIRLVELDELAHLKEQHIPRETTAEVPVLSGHITQARRGLVFASQRAANRL